MDRRVLREYKKYSKAKYANPSSWYKEGVLAKNALVEARKTIANFISSHPDEVVFTSGGTEANNMGILGTVEALHSTGVDYKDMHIVKSAIEHSSVNECFAELAKRGVKVDDVYVSNQGTVDLDDIQRKIKTNTILVSIMMVNNETGVIQPIREIAKVIRKTRQSNLVGNIYPIFHTDAGQAMYLDINVEKLGVDLLTLDSGKMYGPRGMGALYVRRNTPIKPIIFGGGQEGGMRSGTENIGGINAFAKAIELIGNNKNKERARVNDIKKYFIEGLRHICHEVVVNGGDAEASPHIVNVSIPGIDNEFFVLQLDTRGIACSTRSSCLHDSDESFVLKAMNANSKTSVRFSFGRNTSLRDIKKTLKIIESLLSKNK
jgi:cysteine desulfurase